MKISFYQRGGIMQARISDGPTQFRLSTGVKASHNSLKAELDAHKAKLKQLYLKYGDLGCIKEEYHYTPEPDHTDYTLESLLKSYVIKMREGQITTKMGRPFSAESIRTYAYVSTLYAEYASKKSIKLPNYHVDPSWPIDRKHRIGENFNKYFKGFDEWLIDKNHGMKSRFNTFNIIGIVAHYWSEILFLNIPKVMRMPNVAKPIVTFPPDFVMRFLNDEGKVYDKLDPEKRMVWEISATILITTMRVGDAISLKPSDFNMVNDTMFLNKRNSKTNAMSQSPLPKLLTDKYKANLARYGSIYSITPTKTKIYEHMKALFMTYKELHECFTISKLGVKGENVTESKPLYEWAHPHLLRKTSITTMIANKVPDRHIKFLSGHSENSSSYGYYVGHVEKHYNSDMTDYFNKNFN